MWSAIPIAAILRAVNEGIQMPLEDGLELEASLFSQLVGSEDLREGLASFIEKRRPRFQDK
jgi:enoyl-CoA hydratase/carnithine racemase